MFDKIEMVTRIETRIESHLNSALTKKVREEVQWHMEMTNKWIDTLANLTRNKE